MYKILIVDDEVFVRMGLKMALQTQVGNFQLIGEASNGKQALDIIERTRPDIVITDIKMPEMDGVTLIKEASSRYPDIKFLVLSNYDDFEYVKEAMKNGAEDYFLKATIETEKIIEVLHSIGEKIKEERSFLPFSAKPEKPLNKNNPSWKNQLLTELVKSDSGEEKINKIIDAAGLKIFSNKGFILLINVDEYYSVVKERFNGDAGFFSTTMDNIIEGVINSQFTGEIFEDKPGCYIILVSNDHYNVSEDEEMWLAERIVKAANDFLSITIKVICGIGFDGFTELKNTVALAKEMREIEFYENNASIFSYRNRGCFSTNVESLYELKKSLPIYIKYLDSEKLKTTVDRMFEIMEKEKIKPSILKSILISVVNSLEEEIRQLHNGNISINGLEVVNNFINDLSFTGVKKIFKRFMKDIIYKMEDLRRSNLRPEIMKVIEYIEKNYMEKISLEQVANLVSMNRSYFCKLFKSETGITFQDYLIKLRMEKARELLINSDMKISDIAEKVGYANVFYFDRYFKVFFDKTPGEVRKNRNL